MKMIALARLWPALALAGLVSVAGCALGPDYHRPPLSTPAAYKEAGDWQPARPDDAHDRGAWWALFDDPTLDVLAAQLIVSNQNIAAAQAAYAQARASVREQRASLFPQVDLSAGVTRTGTHASGTTVVNSGGTVTTGGDRIRTNYQASIGASWEPDVWGRLRRTLESADANLQASAADLASATLSAHGELVTNYLSLRATDAEIALLQKTLDGYQRAATIAGNRYQVGVAPRSDLLGAQSQWYSTQAELEGLHRTRAQLEHAIAVLLGKAPAQFSLAVAAWNGIVPRVPIGVPSTLLQRRPDIAAAERQVAAANANIGIQQSAWFPNFSLSGSYGTSASVLHELFNTSTLLWSIGASASEAVLDFGARSARVAGARASYNQAVARYRQTALMAFQDVEDQLSATRVLERQYALRAQASALADENEQLLLNRYRAGQVSFSEVISAQASALNARRALVQAARDRQITAVALIQALGGAWQTAPESP